MQFKCVLAAFILYKALIVTEVHQALYIISNKQMNFPDNYLPYFEFEKKLNSGIIL